MKTLLIKRLFMTLIVIFMLFLTIQETPIIASDLNIDEEFNSSFNSINYNNLATIDHVDMFAHDGTNYGTALESGVTLIPQQQYKIALNIMDQDTIADLESIEIRFWYSGDADTFESHQEINTNGETFVMKWTALDTSFSLVNQDTILSSDVSWSMLTSLTPVETDLTASSFVFEIEFVISKVAPRSDNAQWHVGAIVEDGRVSVEASEKENFITQSQVAKLNIGSSLDVGFNMAFYGEVILPEVAQYAWTDVSAGIRFIDENNQSLNDIIFISNDNYESQIKSSEVWEAVLTQDAIDSLGLTPTDEIAIELVLGVATLVGVTFQDFNDALNETILLYESIFLPGIEGDNLTGATLTSSEALLEDEKQLFAIGFADFAAADGLGYTTISSTFTAFEEQTDASRQRSSELGQTITLLLTIALSDYFQNARYEGVLTINITNLTT